MKANNQVQDLFAKILVISQSDSQIPPATRNDLVFQRFSCPPIIPEDDEDEGMWFVVNKSLDSLFGVENCKDNLRRGKYGIEVVLDYLKRAREHSSWNADELLVLKLERIYKCFEEAGGVIAKEPPKKPTPKNTKETSATSNKPSNASATPKYPKSTTGDSKKRKSGSRREVHDLDFKLNVIQWHEENKATQQVTAKKFGINQTSLSCWLKEKRVAYNGGGVKRQRTAAYPQLEQALFNWFLEAQARHMPTNDDIL
ncbi:tigger transposable element derived 3 [Puccinia graminis f. sp. tritici]|uniref:Tigger transposable element derived 3 n=1 Tax=Puccinia graminis f. sp. tritici TaxID=56615 RepID=A0A5B0P5J6_PUCGR|nr:tigger transposable element derived 3 [Puccinia graminis f. sp. tritici]